MRRLDKAAILVPMGVSIVMAASKVLLSLTAIWGAVQFAVGLSKDPPAVSGGWLIVVAGCGTLLGIAMGAYTKYQKRRLEYTSAYTETLYYQTLDSEAGAFLRVLDEAFEEEAKEAVLAWVFTRRHGDLPLDELDARVERWLEEKTGRKVDFEVEDAVGKLERLGVSGAQQAPS
jgi:ABC-type glycerol-3-phosphate transport system substrate-binding protein